MNSENKSHGLTHLLDQPDAEEEVLVVDFDNLSVINAVASNVSEWGFRLTSPDIGELYKNIGVRPKDASKLVKAHVTSVKGNDAAVVFAKSEKSVSDKRREKRNNVSIPVKIADLDGITEISGTIVDAGKNGCRITAKGLTALPEEVLLTMKNSKGRSSPNSPGAMTPPPACVSCGIGRLSRTTITETTTRPTSPQKRIPKNPRASDMARLCCGRRVSQSTSHN